MPDYFPARERLLLIRHGNPDFMVPIIGFTVEGVTALPICLAGTPSFEKGDAVFFATADKVQDLTSGETHDSLEIFHDSRPEYQIGETLFGPDPKPPVPPANPRTGRISQLQGVGPWNIKFSLKTYAKRSMWKYEINGSIIFVMAIEPGNGTPVGLNISKINRDMFQELKNTGVPNYTLAEVRGERPMGEAPPFDQQTPPDDDDDTDGDDDAAMNLV